MPIPDAGATDDILKQTDNYIDDLAREGNEIELYKQLDNFDGIGATGKYGEDLLKKEYGGISQYRFETQEGVRIADQYNDLTREMYESKVGYTSKTARIEKQVLKDKILIDSNQVDSVTWVFYKSPVTGKGGPSKPLEDLLKQKIFQLL